MLLGIENFIKNGMDQIKLKKVGLVANNSSRDSELNSTFELISNMKNYKELEILAPEHGYFGELQAGQTYESKYDETLGTKILSLYSGNDDFTDDLDNSMRKTDSRNGVELPGIYKATEELDTIIFDLQDVGCRVYTYISTLVNLIDVTHDKNLDLIILDRPNPNSGIGINGPMLEPDLHSFIGNANIPLKHNLTMAEIAKLHILEKGYDSEFLKIFEMMGWKRDNWYEDTLLPWVPPSPNLPTTDAVSVYPGMVLLEGTNLSEGRGTTRPFLTFGSPWLNAKSIREEVQSYMGDSVKLVFTKYIPMFSKYSGQLNNGLNIYVHNKRELNQFELALSIIQSVFRRHEDKLVFYNHYFDRVAGTSKLRKMILDGIETDEILLSFKDELDKFEEISSEILIY